MLIVDFLQVLKALRTPLSERSLEQRGIVANDSASLVRHERGLEPQVTATPRHQLK